MQTSEKTGEYDGGNDQELSQIMFPKSFLDLPNEIHRHILSYLMYEELSESVSSTCKSLYVLVRTILKGRYRLKAENIENVVTQKEIAESISYLIIQQDHSKWNLTYEWLEATDNLLEGERVSGDGILCSSPSFEAIKLVVQHCPNLKYFYWLGKHLQVSANAESQVIIDESIDVYEQSLLNLPELLEKCPKLEFVWCSDISYKFRISSKGRPNLPDNTIQYPKLSMLKLNNVEATISLALIQKSSALKSLTITNCDEMSDDSLVGMLKKLKDVEHLTLSVNENLLSDPLLQVWFAQLPLVTLCLCNRSDDSYGYQPANMDHMTLTLKNLKSLKFGKEILISDSALLRIMRNCTDMEELLMYDGPTFHVDTMTSAIGGCKGLKKIEFSPSQFITNDLLREIGGSHPELIELNISNKWKITDEGLSHLLESCSGIKKLNVSGTQLTDTSFKSIANNLKCLTHLISRRCDCITDDAIINVIQSCVDLKVLDVGWCYTLTNKALKGIARFPNNLIHLSIPGLFKAVDGPEIIIEVVTRSLDLQYLTFLDCRDAIHTKKFKPKFDKFFENLKSVRPMFKVIIEENFW
jgi:hypothetical protein